MKNSDGEPAIEDVTSEIVRIAYRQSRELSGTDESEDAAGKNKRDKNKLACTQRLAKFPIIASINSSITEAYSSVKESHSAIEAILNKTEESITEGAKIVSPVTSKIGETLDEPLKNIDNVICEGLDYLEDNLPSVKLPPAEMYKNAEGYVRNISDKVKKHSTEICADLKHKLGELAQVVQGEAGKKSTEAKTSQHNPENR